MAAVANEASEITWSAEEVVIEKVIENDPDLQEIAAKFENDVSIEPDTDLNIDPTDKVLRDSDSASNSSSLRDVDDNTDETCKGSRREQSTKNGDLEQSQVVKVSPKETVDTSDKKKKKGSKIFKDREKSTNTASDSDSVNSKKNSQTERKNPLKMLKKLTKFDKSSKKSSFRSEFATVVVDKLPQVFVAKYLGHRAVGGVSGLHHVRKPVDEMIQQVRAKIDAKEEIGLPLLYVVVSPKGLDLREHPSNKVKGMAPLGMIPIDFISYGVQDIKYWKVFTCIVVRTLSWQSRTATCHAFLCDSSHSGRKMAVSLGAAFNVYAKKLKADGKTHNFQVELRPPDELVDEIPECEA